MQGVALHLLKTLLKKGFKNSKNFWKREEQTYRNVAGVG